MEQYIHILRNVSINKGIELITDALSISITNDWRYWIYHAGVNFENRASTEEKVMQFAVDTINNSTHILPDHRIEVIANYSYFHDHFRNIQNGEHPVTGDMFACILLQCATSWNKGSAPSLVRCHPGQWRPLTPFCSACTCPKSPRQPRIQCWPIQAPTVTWSEWHRLTPNRARHWWISWSTSDGIHLLYWLITQTMVSIEYMHHV